MKKVLILLSVLLVSSLFADATNLFISEYVEGSGLNKLIEIYNGTGAEIDLANFSIKKQVNGEGEFQNELALEGTLANDDVFVICNSGADIVNDDFVDMSTGSQSMNFNGNDAVALCQNGNPIDIVGVVDSADDWGKDMTLVRLSSVSSPTTTYNVGEWTQHPQDTFEFLGYHDFSGGSEDPQIIVTSPAEGDTWVAGETYTITWNNINFEENVTLFLDMTVKEPQIIAENIENTGSYEWTIPESAIYDECIISVYDAADNDPTGTSGLFSIIDGWPEVSIYDIQYVENPSENDASPYAGQTVTTNGVVTAVFENLCFIQDGAGAWNGLAVYPAQEVSMGDEINITGEIAEYNGKTEITNISNLEIVQSTDLPDTVIITTADLNNDEAYEGVLVQIEEASVAGEMNEYGVWTLEDASGTCPVDDSGNYEYVPVIDDAFTSVVGIVDYSYGEFKLEPRTDADFYFGNSTNEIVASAKLLGNYPNPFNPETTISYTVNKPGKVEISIFNILGQKVRTFAANHNDSGKQSIVWSGNDQKGNSVSSGVYFYKLETKDTIDTKKMILMK